MPLYIKNLRTYVFISYFFEVLAKLLGQGLYKFLNGWNIFDTILTVYYAIFIYSTGLISTDLSPLKCLKILVFLAKVSGRMRMMLGAIINSFKFLTEALYSVLLFTMFFALIGLHLLNGAYRYRCFELEFGVIHEELRCGFSAHCSEHGTICLKTMINSEPSNQYDDIFYSFMQSLKTLTMDGWTE